MKYTAEEARKIAEKITEKINSDKDNAIYEEVNREIVKAVEKGLMEVTLSKSIPLKLKDDLISIFKYKVKYVQIGILNAYGTLISWSKDEL